jgi:hypothetical protein
MFWWEALVRMRCHARFLLKGHKHPVVRELHALRGKIRIWN